MFKKIIVNRPPTTPPPLPQKKNCETIMSWVSFFYFVVFLLCNHISVIYVYHWWYEFCHLILHKQFVLNSSFTINIHQGRLVLSKLTCHPALLLSWLFFGGNNKIKKKCLIAGYIRTSITCWFECLACKLEINIIRN